MLIVKLELIAECSVMKAFELTKSLAMLPYTTVTISHLMKVPVFVVVLCSLTFINLI